MVHKDSEEALARRRHLARHRGCLRHRRDDVMYVVAERRLAPRVPAVAASLRLHGAHCAGANLLASSGDLERAFIFGSIGVARERDVDPMVAPTMSVDADRSGLVLRNASVHADPMHDAVAKVAGGVHADRWGEGFAGARLPAAEMPSECQRRAREPGDQLVVGGAAFEPRRASWSVRTWRRPEMRWRRTGRTPRGALGERAAGGPRRRRAARRVGRGAARRRGAGRRDQEHDEVGRSRVGDRGPARWGS